jgi:hypothetical protein
MNNNQDTSSRKRKRDNLNMSNQSTRDFQRTSSNNMNPSTNSIGSETLGGPRTAFAVIIYRGKKRTIPVLGEDAPAAAPDRGWQLSSAALEGELARPAAPPSDEGRLLRSAGPGVNAPAAAPGRDRLLNEANIEDEEAPQPKRGRDRPRKTPAAQSGCGSNDPIAPKRGRGRPPQRAPPPQSRTSSTRMTLTMVPSTSIWLRPVRTMSRTLPLTRALSRTPRLRYPTRNCLLSVVVRADPARTLHPKRKRRSLSDGRGRTPSSQRTSGRRPELGSSAGQT